MSPAAARGLVRFGFYLWFALVTGLVAMGVITALWRLAGGSSRTEPDFLASVVVLGVLLGLVLPVHRRFTQPMKYGKWFALCAAATVLGAIALVYSFSIHFCVVCL